MNRAKTQEHHSPNLLLCFVIAVGQRGNLCEISQWQEDIQYWTIPNNPSLQEYTGNARHSFTRFTEIRVLWFVALNQNIYLGQGSGKCRFVSFTKLLSLHKYCQSELSESSGLIGVVKNISNSLWTHNKSMFWGGTYWDFFPHNNSVAHINGAQERGHTPSSAQHQWPLVQPTQKLHL